MKISREDVLYVAELAHLELSEAEVETYRQQLDSILTYIDKLNQLDTSAVEPMAQVLAGTPGPEEASWREDQVRPSSIADEALATIKASKDISFFLARPSSIADEALAAAPDAANHYFRVPKVIER